MRQNKKEVWHLPWVVTAVREINYWEWFVSEWLTNTIVAEDFIAERIQRIISDDCLWQSFLTNLITWQLLFMISGNDHCTLPIKCPQKRSGISIVSCNREAIDWTNIMSSKRWVCLPPHFFLCINSRLWEMAQAYQNYQRLALTVTGVHACRAKSSPGTSDVGSQA